MERHPFLTELNHSANKSSQWRSPGMSRRASKHHSLASATVVLLVISLLAACGSPSPTATPVPKTKLAVQVSWIHGIEFAGFNMADKKGYFADQNLSVDLLAGGYDKDGNYIDPVQAVINKKADFGIAGADVILTGRAQGQPLVAVAAIYQRSPVALISLSKSNINKPQDLVGKKVNTEPGTTIGISYDALLAALNIDHKQITEIPRTDFTAAPLIKGDVDVLVSFITDDAIQARRTDPNASVILLSDYGVDIYSDVIFTTEDTIKNKPAMVAGFVKATVKGMQAVVDDPKTATQYILDKYGKDLPADVQRLQQPGLLAAPPLLNPAGSRPGMMQGDKWQRTYQILGKQGTFSKPVYGNPT